ncbi:hypothetical protein HYS47_02565 [Candidatus Woesearchaeota archaeon]|nr:hypothetical protein [Candidatus Woesearchaeota archaeon]
MFSVIAAYPELVSSADKYLWIGLFDRFGTSTAIPEIEADDLNTKTRAFFSGLERLAKGYVGMKSDSQK